MKELARWTLILAISSSAAAVACSSEGGAGREADGGGGGGGLDGGTDGGDIADAGMKDADAGFDGGSTADNPTLRENRRPGDPTFLDGVSPAAQRCHQGQDTCVLEAYADRASVGVGETIGFHVSGRGSDGQDVPYTVTIFRLGYYGGRGAARKAELTPSAPATKRPMPAPDPTTGRTVAGWPVSLTTVVGGSGWSDTRPVSGQYVAKLQATGGSDAGYATFVPFVVRPGPDEGAEILVLIPDLTWQVYNEWGGCSFYKCPLCPSIVDGTGTADPSDDCPTCCDRTGGLLHPAVAVSFDRPYATVGRSRALPGTAHLPFWEFWTLSWLESEGYHVAYASGLDIDDPVRGDPTALAARFQVVVSIGHDEYWTRRMRDHLEAARALGLHLAFLSGNTAAWQVRLEDGGRTVVGYKYLYFRDPLFALDDPDMTGPYRDFDPAAVCAVDPTLYPVCSAPPNKISRPESALTGMMATDLTWPWGDAHVPASMLGHWALDGLGLTSTDDLIAEQLFGHEGMSDDPLYRPTDGRVEILATDTNLCHTNSLAATDNLSMSLWTPSTGGMVFNGGSTQWGWFLAKPLGSNPVNTCSGIKWAQCRGQLGCDQDGIHGPMLRLPSERVRQLTRNILDCFTGRRALSPRCGRG